MYSQKGFKSTSDPKDVIVPDVDRKKYVNGAA